MAGLPDDDSATHAESLKVVLAEHKGPLTTPFEMAAEVVGERLCEWYASRLLTDETYQVEGSAGWMELVDLCAKLKAHRYGDDEFATRRCQRCKCRTAPYQAESDDAGRHSG